MRHLFLAILSSMVLICSSLPAAVVFEATSPYHHIRVTDDGGLRTLCFDDALETRMLLQDPLKGHFEYTEYFHMAWLWNTQLTNVLMIGLGGGSTQRSFEHYYPGLKIETVEIDPKVVEVAKDYFHFTESDAQKVHVEDGRLFLRRSTARYDLAVLDAYINGRYGSSIPQHLATKEFFVLVRDHLTTNGVVAYNVIGTVNGWHADIVGAIYQTLKAVFPQVYLFPARSSQNVVLIATRAGYRTDMANLLQRTGVLQQIRRVTLPTFRERLQTFRLLPPTSAARSPVLTDDYAPVEGLAAAAGP
jgi:spermidine synthase